METIAEDFMIGFVFGLSTIFVAPFDGVMPALACGIFWAMGGQGFEGTKAWRRILVPAMIAGQFLAHGHERGAFISGCLQLAWQTVGYGVPDSTDKGSRLGRMFGKHDKTIWLLVYAIFMVPLFFK